MVSTLECIGSRSPCGKNLLSVSGDLPEEEVAIFFFSLLLTVPSEQDLF